MRVKAQVMTRGEYGWKPLEGGGMSYVCVHKRWSQKDEVVPKYFIQGTRISDDVVQRFLFGFVQCFPGVQLSSIVRILALRL